MLSQFLIDVPQVQKKVENHCSKPYNLVFYFLDYFRYLGDYESVLHKHTKPFNTFSTYYIIKSNYDNIKFYNFNVEL